MANSLFELEYSFELQMEIGCTSLGSLYLMHLISAVK